MILPVGLLHEHPAQSPCGIVACLSFRHSEPKTILDLWIEKGEGEIEGRDTAVKQLLEDMNPDRTRGAAEPDRAVNASESGKERQGNHGTDVNW